MVITWATSMSAYGRYWWLLSSPVWIRLSDTYPLNGGMPAMDAAPITNATARTGMRRARPPMSDSFVSPVRCRMAPAHRNSSDLNRAWLTRW